MSGTESDDIRRPSPEALLKLAHDEETSEEQGKLKIFLGYAAGVGKTYSMLEAAQQRRKEGRDVVAAYVETHGRHETDVLLEGLEILPHRQVPHQGVTLPELDLDALLARKPHIALVDELAHSNAPGSRHEKRWQDVVELLAARIDVYTTVNIQHFESLKDAVAQVTGVVMRETVPDHLLDLAQEIRLVDLPPEELLQRLREGKVYVPEQARLAMRSFFKPGNLMALRELSLRRAAARVDDQMRAYMESRAIPGPWPVAERLLVAVSGSPYGERLIRATKRLADELKAPWHTVYIETPAMSRQVRENRSRVWRDLRLAETLGAQVTTLTSVTVADALVGYAVKNNVTKIVMGKPTRPRWRDYFGHPLVDQVIRRSGPINVEVVSFAKVGGRPKIQVEKERPARAEVWPGYLKSLLLVVGATALCEALRSYLVPTNLMMVYLFAVIFAATKLGRTPSVVTAFLSVFAFDFFFVPPRFTLAVAETEYVVTFVAFFTVGVVISTLVNQARERADAIREREAQTASLYHLSRDLAGASDLRGVLDAVIRNAEESLEARVAILLPEGERLELRGASAELTLSTKEHAVADWVFRNRVPAGRGTETLSEAQLLYLPLQTTGENLGVIGVELPEQAQYHSPQGRRLLQAFATQAVMAIERVQLTMQAEQAQILAARETLERALLNSISHDLRTPLVSISGALDTLRAPDSRISPQTSRELVQTAWEQAERLNRFVGNLLDMTRLQAGALKPKAEPCDVQDLVGCALAALEERLEGRPVTIDLPADLPPVHMDLVLMTQVLVNLLDNALKYAPPASEIGIAARTDEHKLVLEISDRGPGIPEQDAKRVFDKFYRIPVPEGAGGTGLGLSICKGIVEVHGGTIHAENRPDGGLKMVITLPLR